MAKKKSLHSHPKISQRGIRIVAVYADCDPRCVVRYLNGMPTTESTRVRVERALLRHGFGNLVRGDVHAIAHELPALDSHAHAPPPSANGASSGTTAPRPIVAVVASSGTTVSRKVSS